MNDTFIFYFFLIADILISQQINYITCKTKIAYLWTSFSCKACKGREIKHNTVCFSLKNKIKKATKTRDNT